MIFCELKYPEAPVPNVQLLGSGTSAAGYVCHLYRMKDTNHLMARINGRDFAIKISSIFQDIVDIVGVESYENKSNNDPQK